MPKKIIINESQFNRIINEAFVDKTEVKNIVKDSLKADKEIEKRVKDIAAEVVKNLFKTLWQRNNFWYDELKK